MTRGANTGLQDGSAHDASGDARPDRPRLWFVSPSLGRSSEPWLLRQIRYMREFEVSAVCWGVEKSPGVDALTLPVHVSPFDLERRSRLRRWASYAMNVGNGDYYACEPAERRWMLGLSAKERPDVMLCHFGFVALRMLPVARRLGVPLVAHFHGLDVSSLLGHRWYRWSLRRCLPEFEHVVVVGSRQQEWMRAQGVEESRLHLIPCGVPTDEFVVRPRAGDGPVRFVAVCRLVAWKGMDVSIRAFASAAAQLPGSTLVVIGDGPEEAALRDLAAGLGLGERVEFRGAQAPEAVCAELARSDVFVQHSLEMHGWYEGFGVSLAEASATGLPVVASRTGGIMDQVVEEQTGVLVPMGDDKAMGDAMVRLGRDRALRERMGAAGRERMVARFDTELQVRKLEGVLLSAVGVRDGAGGA